MNILKCSISFTKSQIKDMNDFIEQHGVEFLEKPKVVSQEDQKQTRPQYKSKKFYYEKYITKVITDNKKHFDSLMTEYKIYSEIKENRDVKDTIPPK